MPPDAPIAQFSKSAPTFDFIRATMRDMNRIRPLIFAGLLAFCLLGCAVTSTTPGRTDLKNQTLEEHREGKSGRRIRITVQPAHAVATPSAEEAQQ